MEVLVRYPQRSPPAPPRADLASQERSPERLDTAKGVCNPHSHKRGTQDAGQPARMITTAERRRFPVRIRIAVPLGGLGRRQAQMTAWLDENCGADGWAMTPSGMRGGLNDALSIYFADATLASAFVAQWCGGAKVETAGGVFQVREDEPKPRVATGLHRTP
jgi:hypothetical protein